MAPPTTNFAAPVNPLLSTKLYVPPPRPNLVPRPRLVAQVQSGMTGKLTLLAAPTGFGKTTLLSDWLASLSAEFPDLRSEVVQSAQPRTPDSSRQPPVAWVSLDVGDNDPQRFWSYVCAALETLLPGVATTALALLQSPQPPPAQTLLPSLLNALSSHAVDCVLVLDDYHVIEADAIHADLTFLLEHVPPTLHLVIASRADPLLPLARLRARGELTELRAADLRFTPAEAAAFLTEVMNLPLTPEDITALEERTEGWIAGLQLAALAMRDRRDLASFISAFTGRQRFVAEYLAEEVFARQPPHIQTFLLQTSILSRMCGPLCDAVLHGGVTGSTLRGSLCQDVLEELERTNLFVVPLDDTQQWYRYHHLFGEMLHARLTRSASEAALATLHRRASAWYAEQGLVVEAVEHALAAHEWGSAAYLIKQHGPMLVMSGQNHTVLGWLETLPATVVQSSPTLYQVHAMALIFMNQFDAAGVRLHDAERALKPNMPTDRVRRAQGSVAVLQGGICFYKGDMAQAISLMQKVLVLLQELPANAVIGPGVATTRTVAAMYAAMAYQLTGDVTEASEQQAIAAIVPARSTRALIETLHGYAYLSWLQVLQGRLRTAAATYAEIERLVANPDRSHTLRGSPAYYFGMGDLLREWDHLDDAHDYLARGIELVQGGMATHAGLIARGYAALAQVHQARGDSGAALGTLQAFIQLAQERKFIPLLIEHVLALRARLQLWQGNLPAALHWVEASGLSPTDDLDFPREAAYLTLARVRIAAGQAKAVAPLLDRLLADATAKARRHSAIEILILQALARQAQGDLPAAQIALEQALAHAEPEGYVRIFVDEGASLAALLTKMPRGTSPLLAYRQRLLAAFHDGQWVVFGQPPQDEGPSTIAQTGRPYPASNTLDRLVEPLSEREREVLALIAAGLSNQEIATRLIVGVSTVKKHINNIFGKLAVSSRTQALARARDLNLL